MRVRGIGIDLVDVARFARIIDKHGASFTDRWFSERERAEAESADAEQPEADCAGSTSGEAERARAPDAPQAGTGLAERFAVKEAVWKALGIARAEDAVPWRGICAYRAGRGWNVELSGQIAQRAAEHAVTGVMCASAVTGGVAIAVAHATPSAPHMPSTSRRQDNSRRTSSSTGAISTGGSCR